MEQDSQLLVEFVGLPAAGKTTVASAVKDVLVQEGDLDVAAGVTTSTEKRNNVRLVTVLKLIIVHVFLSPVRSLRSLVYLHRTKPKTLLELLRYFLYQLYMCEELRRAKVEETVHLADQGFLQHLWRIRLKSTEEDSSHLLSLAQLYYPPLEPDIVVFVNVDHHTRMTRGKQREGVDDALFDPEHPAIQKDLRTYREIKELVPRISDQLETDIHIVNIENREDNIEENAREIADRIVSQGGFRDRDDPSQNYVSDGQASTAG